MNNIKRVALLTVSLLVFALALPVRAADSTAATTCKDGTTSTASGRGACSGHGGVQKAAPATATGAAPASAPAAAPAAAPATPAAPAATCKDGTTSTATGRGACSGHGGVQKTSTGKSATAAAPAAAPAAAAPTAAAAPAQPKSSTAAKSAPTATASNTDPTGATAKCKDGTYSKSQHHSGTCSSHGGVAEWLDAQK